MPDQSQPPKPSERTRVHAVVRAISPGGGHATLVLDDHRTLEVAITAELVASLRVGDHGVGYVDRHFRLVAWEPTRTGRP